ncbi:hypothetical protein ACOJVU_21080 [Mycobacterium sp. THU-M104]|uniref:hypothetical protein n=1 Tax=Mycobacterium sp. THU-M104 TaxID=3410515 RepID=UPI003B99B84D
MSPSGSTPWPASRALGRRAAIAGYLDGHRRGRLGTVETSAEMFGLDEDDLRARFAPHVERFLA